MLPRRAAQVPQVLSGRWPRDQVLLLFDELLSGAEIKHVQLRGQFPGRSADRQSTLEEARVAYLEERATAIQIRYEFENNLWCDTILPEQGTAQVIRTQLPRAEASS